MKKQILFLIICLTGAINSFAQTYSGGSGTEANPFRISSKSDMEALANAVNTNADYSTGKHFLLTRDLMGSDRVRTIIGRSVNELYSSEHYPFKGIFDGGNHTIELDISTVGEFAGLFGIADKATIKNITVSGKVYFRSYDPNRSGLYLGGICGKASSCTITNCTNIAEVSAIFRCSATSDVRLLFKLGGICGEASSCTIANCTNIGSISAWSTTSAWAGGICGNDLSSTTTIITNCTNTGNVSAVSEGCGYLGLMSHASLAGGICGSGGTITNCTNTGNISADSEYYSSNSNYSLSIRSGGICGRDGTVTNCTNTGRVTSYSNIPAPSSPYSSSHYSGGICGSGNATNCINGGDVSSYNYYSDSYSGGIIGREGNVNNCVVGNVSIHNQNSEYLHRIVGSNSATVNNSYASVGALLNEVNISSQDAASKNGKDFESLIIVDGNIIPAVDNSVVASIGQEITIVLTTTNPTKWQRSTNNGNSWVDIACTDVFYTETNPIEGTFLYRAQNKNGTFSNILKVILTVGKAPQVIIFDEILAKTYGDGPFVLPEKTDKGLAISYQSSNTAVATISGNTVTIRGVGATNITASQAGDINYLAATSVTRTLTVNETPQTKEPQIITFNEIPVKVYGDGNFTLPEKTDRGLTISYQSSNTNVATISGNTVTVKRPGTTTVSATQAGNDNYLAATPVSRELTVNPAPQIIIFPEFEVKTYGDANIPLSGYSNIGSPNSGLGLPITYTSSNTNVAEIKNRDIVIKNAGTAQITATVTQMNENCYPAEPVIRTLTVNKAPQTITFNNISKTYGDAPFTLPEKTDKGLTISYQSSNTAVATISGNRVTITGVGTANITASQTGDDNHLAVSVTRTLTVDDASQSKSSQAITFDEIPVKVYGDEAFSLPEKTDKGLTVSYQSSNTNVATVSENTVTIKRPGTTTITATQEGNDNYLAATPVSQELTVNPAPQIIIFPEFEAKTYGDVNIPLNAFSNIGSPNSGSGLSITYTSSNTNVAEIKHRDIINKDIVIKNAGTTQITATVTHMDEFCYPAEPVIRTLTVNKALLFITSDDKTRTQGEENPPFTMTFSGFKNGDNESNLDELPDIFCGAMPHSSPGFYYVDLVGGSDKNYEYQLVLGLLEITEGTDLEEVEVLQISVYPNPATNHLFIQSDYPVKQVEMFDLSGMRVVKNNEETGQVDVSKLPAGLYIVRVYTNDTILSQKIIIRRNKF